MILFHKETNFELKKKKQYKNWIITIVEYFEKRVGDINYIFCDDSFLLEINQQYLQHDTYTDIITFDNSEDNIISGDIFISIERVRENAEIFSKTFDDELRRVISHGVLHLCGFKDKTEKQSKQMRVMEEWALELFSK